MVGALFLRCAVHSRHGDERILVSSLVVAASLQSAIASFVGLRRNVFGQATSAGTLACRAELTCRPRGTTRLLSEDPFNPVA